MRRFDEEGWQLGTDFDLLPDIEPDAGGGYPLPSGLVGFVIEAKEQPADEALWLIRVQRPGVSELLFRSAMNARARYLWRAGLDGKIIGATRLTIEGATVPVRVRARAI